LVLKSLPSSSGNIFQQRKNVGSLHQTTN